MNGVVFLVIAWCVIFYFSIGNIIAGSFFLILLSGFTLATVAGF